MQHNFEGDVKILNDTLDTRSGLRTCLTKLAQEVQKIEAQPVEVVGEMAWTTISRPCLRRVGAEIPNCWKRGFLPS